jgi:hypothetical protein
MVIALENADRLAILRRKRTDGVGVSDRRDDFSDGYV